MKKSLLLLPFLLLAGCAPKKANETTDQPNDVVDSSENNDVVEPEIEREQLVAYQDCSVGHSETLCIQKEDFGYIDRTSSGGMYYCSITLSIKNTSNEPVPVVVQSFSIVDEEIEQFYPLRTTNATSFTVNPNRREFLQFFNDISGPINEHCYFNLVLKTVNYKMYFVNKPEELKRDITVTYQLDNGQVVNTKTVKEGNPTILNYVYDSDDHQTYANVWKDDVGRIYQYDTPILDDIVLTGKVEECFEYSGGGSYVSRLCHVPEDGKVVVINKYHSDNFCIAPSAFSNTSGMVELFLPRELKIICDYNFRSSKPQIVYFEGSEEEWNAVRLDCGSFPSSTQIFFNVSFFD